MCLYTNQKKAKRAIFPKVRYKVLKATPIEGIYYTPYQELKVTPDSNKVLKADHFYITPYRGGEVELGIHTFKTEKIAKCKAREWGFTSCVFKVIIPIGTYYFNGEFGNPNDASCSQKIRFIKEIKTK